ncbi:MULTISPECIES: acetyltransferase [Deinococcus]|uniref:acetyltransferase n=1 Tax=Deinococcus TaxID=1298 RepID=UPI001E3AE77B|nr:MULTISPECIES: acetyltransferase [Deinococcus]
MIPEPAKATPDLHVIGAGGHARVIVALAQAAGYRIAGIFDDQPANPALLLGHPVSGSVRDIPDSVDTWAVIAIGSNAVRERLAAQFRQVQWATLIHPAAWVAPDVVVGPGSVVMAGAVLQPGVRIGTHVIVNTLAGIDHDCRLDDYVHVAPGCRLAGNVHLETGVFAGVGCSFIPGVTVGPWAQLGAGAVITGALPGGVTAVGIPARPMRGR